MVMTDDLVTLPTASLNPSASVSPQKAPVAPLSEEANPKLCHPTCVCSCLPVGGGARVSALSGFFFVASVLCTDTASA